MYQPLVSLRVEESTSVPVRKYRAHSQPSFSLRRSLVIVGVAITLLILVGQRASQPLRYAIAQRFLERGDTYFQALAFDEAEHEYRKGLALQPSLPGLKEHLAYVQVAPTDIAQAKPFFQEKKVSTVLEKLAKAQKTYPTAKAAAQAGVDLYNQGEYVYAQYPLQQAVQLDPTYPEAWHYLGKVYQVLAKDNSSYREKTSSAFAKRDSLTVRFLDTQRGGGL